MLPTSWTFELDVSSYVNSVMFWTIPRTKRCASFHWCSYASGNTETRWFIVYADLFPVILEIKFGVYLHVPFFLLQDSSIIVSVVRKLLLNFVTRPKFPQNGSHPVFSDDGRPGVLQRVGSAAGNVDSFLQLIVNKNKSYYYIIFMTCIMSMP